MLRGSRAGEVIEELEELRDGVGLSARQRHEVQGEINYLKSNQGRMDYRRYRLEGCRSAVGRWRVRARTWWGRG